MEKKIDLISPSKDTWFICWDDKRAEVKSYSLVSPLESMSTLWKEIDYYETEIEWLTELLKQGINPHDK
tara:strand:- start:517 stop:723 length:207 start_codon:yes stop_codon:yes gene_type:complete